MPRITGRHRTDVEPIGKHRTTARPLLKHRPGIVAWPRRSERRAAATTALQLAVARPEQPFELLVARLPTGSRFGCSGHQAQQVWQRGMTIQDGMPAPPASCARRSFSSRARPRWRSVLRSASSTGRSAASLRDCRGDRWRKNIGAARDGRDPASRAGAHSAGERVRVDRQPDPPTMPTIAAIPSGKLCSSSRMRLGPGIMGRCRPPVVNSLSDSPFVEGCMLATPPKTADGTRRQSLPGGALFGGARQLKEP